VVITIPAKDGYPDGMTIDSEGMLWIALWDGWKLVRYNPNTGEQMDEINLPFARVTSCTFGGDNLDQIYVTSATTGLTEEQLLAQPLAGSLLVLKDTGFRGLPAFAFNA